MAKKKSRSRVGPEPGAPLANANIATVATADVQQTVRDLRHQNLKLSSLLNVSREMMKEVQLDNLLRIIMDRVTVVMDAERSTLFLLDQKRGELYAKVAQGTDSGMIRFPVGQGLAGHVGKTGETINITDAYRDSRFNRSFDQMTGFRTRAILCMPIQNTRGVIIGVTQVLNKKKGDRPFFTEEDENLLAAFSSIAAISLENSFAYETINRTMHTFEKFVPRRYLDSIAKDGLESIMIGNAEEATLSVLFSDIREFTNLSEKLKADDLLRFLNSYLTQMSGVIAREKGFIDKFIGDAIMAIFDQKTANSAVDAGIGMLRALVPFNQGRLKAGYIPVEIGIGINTGSAVIGTVGSQDRMDSTVIGDAVNLAARVEGLTKLYGCPLLITENTLKALRGRTGYSVREIDTVQVKGKDRPVRIYEIFDWQTANERQRKIEALPLLQAGIRFYKKRQWAKALEKFEAGKKKNARDKLFQVYIKRCLQYQAQPGILPANWNGTARLSEK